MKGLRAWIVRLGGLWRRERRERELAAELESHVQLHVDDNVRAGMSLDAARRAALLKLGGMEPTKDACRERAGIPLLEQVLQDLRFTLRQLARNPGFTFTAIFTLTLGLGASTALFAFVDAALIRPLPYAAPERLVSVSESIRPLVRRSQISYQDYRDWKALNNSFGSLEVFNGRGAMLSTPSGAELVTVTRVSEGFFHTLGIVPFLGRGFHAGEDLPGAPETAILSYDTWQARFSGSPDVIGTSAVLSGVAHTIVGVLPREFQFAPRGATEFWTPLQGSNACELRRSCHNLNGLGRLKDNVSVQAANADLQTIAAQLEKQYPDSNRGQGASVIALSEAIVGDVRPILLVLLGGAGLLLVIAAVNVASLLLVRSEGRRREVAVRGALGASRARLVRQFTTEGLALVAASGLLGLIVAACAMRFCTSLIPAGMLAGMPYLQELGLNSHVLGFAILAALLAAGLFSVTPLMRLPLTDLRAGLKQNTRGGGSLTWRRLGSQLVVVELAVAVVLLVGAGLLGKSFHRLLHVELGFEPDQLVTLALAAPAARYASTNDTIALGREVVRVVGSLPGVDSAAVTSLLPVSFNGNTDWIRIVGQAYNGEHNEVNQRDVSADYFKTLRTTLLRGRFFADAEDSTKPRVVVINRALAERYFPGQDPIGQHFGDTSLAPGSIKEVVGVVDDVREGALDADIWPAVYYPFNQEPDKEFTIIARTSQAPALAAALPAALRRIDSGLGLREPVTMARRIDTSSAAYLRRSSAWLIGAFATLALLLGVVGLYGTIAFATDQRSREIAVRMALGAQPGSVYRLILTEAGRLAGLGIVFGIVGSLGVATLMRTLLFRTQAWDPATLAWVTGVLGACALLASYIPARRAASVDPVVALRAE